MGVVFTGKNRDMNIEEIYKYNCETPSDISEHLPVLKEYYDQCEHVTEIGVRGGISLSAALVSNAKKVVAYDISPVSVPESDKLTFICASSLEVEIEPTDFLFIDSKHTYSQLKQELNLHAKNVRKWIGMHDTNFWGTNGENGERGLNFAINEFLTDNMSWEVELVLQNNNGLTVLKRIN